MKHLAYALTAIAVLSWAHFFAHSGPVEKPNYTGDVSCQTFPEGHKHNCWTERYTGWKATR